MLGSTLARRHLRRVWRRLMPVMPFVLLGLIIVVPIALFVWLLLYTNIFTVQAITVVDAREHTLAAARDIIERDLEALTFGRTIFLVRTEDLESEIMSALPQVRNVHVSRKLPGTIKAIIQEKTPALLLLSQGQYYFVDESGVPYEEARLETLPGIVLPIVKNDDQSGLVTFGVPVVSADFVAFLSHLQEELPSRAGSEVVEIRIPSLSAREVQVRLSADWYINFDITRPPEEQLDVLHQLLSTKLTEEERLQLEYIDMRIPSRVYYRLKGAADTLSE